MTTFLEGEPHVLEHQKHVDEQMASMVGFANFTNAVSVDNHVELWQLTRDGAKVNESC